MLFFSWSLSRFRIEPLGSFAVACLPNVAFAFLFGLGQLVLSLSLLWGKDVGWVAPEWVYQVTLMSPYIAGAIGPYIAGAIGP